MNAAKNNKKKKNSVSTARFNPYIIPLMLVLGILPLIVHLKEYKTNLEGYAFFGSSEFYDIFLYYKTIYAGLL